MIISIADEHGNQADVDFGLKVDTNLDEPANVAIFIAAVKEAQAKIKEAQEENGPTDREPATPW